MRIAGLRGGHSGIDIIEQRGNAIKILARILLKISCSADLHLASVRGGNKRNAIPREAEALICIRPSDADLVRKTAKTEAADIRIELGGREPELAAELEAGGEVPTNVMNDTSRKKALDLLMAIPHGVDAMSYDIPGLVETSNNAVECGEEDR